MEEETHSSCLWQEITYNAAWRPSYDRMKNVLGPLSTVSIIQYPPYIAY